MYVSLFEDTLSASLSLSLLILFCLEYCRTHGHCLCIFTSIHSHGHHACTHIYSQMHIHAHTHMWQTPPNAYMHTNYTWMHIRVHEKHPLSHTNIYRYIVTCTIYMLHTHTQTYHTLIIVHTLTHMYTLILTHSYSYAITLHIFSYSYTQNTHIFLQNHMHSFTLSHTNILTSICMQTYTHT